MLRKATIVLLTLAMLGVTVSESAMANDPAPNTKDRKMHTTHKKANTKGGSSMSTMSPSGSGMGMTSPATKPNNTKDGSSRKSTTSAQDTSTP